MRATSNIHTAIERIAPFVPKVKVRRRKRGYTVTVPRSGLSATRKSAIQTLAFLADLVRSPEARKAVRWHGRVPSRGISAWEEAALVRLRGDL